MNRGQRETSYLSQDDEKQKVKARCRSRRRWSHKEIAEGEISAGRGFFLSFEEYGGWGMDMHVLMGRRA